MRSPSCSVSTANSAIRGASDLRDGGDIGVLIEQHQLLELDVADLAVIAEHEFGCGQ